MTITTERNIRILLVNEQVIIRSGLRLLLESHPGFEVVCEAANFTEIGATTDAPPDIILLDLKTFSQQACDETLPELMKSVGKARILLLIDENDLEGNLNAVRHGAMGLVHKNESTEVLLKAIERVHAGEVWINRTLMARVIEGLGNPAKAQNSLPDQDAVKITALTERERVRAIFKEAGLLSEVDPEMVKQYVKPRSKEEVEEMRQRLRQLSFSPTFSEMIIEDRGPR